MNAPNWVRQTAIACTCALCIGIASEGFYSLHGENGLGEAIVLKQEWLPTDHPEHATTRSGPPSELRIVVGTTGSIAFYQVGLENPWLQ